MNSWDNAFRGEPGQGLSHTYSFGGAGSFFRVPYGRDLDGIDMAVTGVPMDLATTNRAGARMGPRAIRQASLSLAWERPWPWTVDPMRAMKVIDYGDCEPPSGNLLSTAHIEDHIASILRSGSAALVLGGDHFVAYPSVRAHAAVHGPLALVHFDAHSDTWETSRNEINHGTMFRHAANEGLVIPGHSSQIGIRTINEDTMGFRTFHAREVHQRTAQDIADEVLARAGDLPVYLTFDIDCLDPAFAPGTGTPVPGGLSTFQALEIIRALRGIRLVGMDVVEVSPAYDHAEITAMAAAQIGIELLCLYADSRQNHSRGDK